MSVSSVGYHFATLADARRIAPRSGNSLGLYKLRRVTGDHIDLSVALSIRQVQNQPVRRAHWGSPERAGAGTRGFTGSKAQHDNLGQVSGSSRG